MWRIMLFPLVCLSLILNTVNAQNYFEQLPFPDSTNIVELAFNSQGDIFASANSSTQLTNNGVYRSINHGQSWEMILQYGQLGAAGIAVDKDDNIYALVNWDLGASLYKSVNNGQSWDSINVPIDMYWSNMEIFVKGTDTLFVTQTGGSPLRLLRSHNDGENWDTVFYKPTSGTEYIQDIAIGDNGEVFMATSSYTVGEGALYKSTDYGTTWNLFSVEGNMIYDLCYNSVGDLFLTIMTGVYERGLYAVFNDEQVISPIAPGPNLITVITNISDDIFAGSFGAGYVYHSSDNGATFNWITSGLNSYSPILHMYVDPEQYVYAVSEGSMIYKSVQSTITSAKIFTIEVPTFFPNPCKDLLTINCNMCTSKNIPFVIIDIKGICVFEGKFDNENITIDLSNLNSGIYFLKIISHDISLPVIKY